MLILSPLRWVTSRFRDTWADGDWKVRLLMGGAVVTAVFFLGLGGMSFLGGGDAEVSGDSLEGVSIGEDGVMEFDDEELAPTAGASVPAAASLGGSAGNSRRSAAGGDMSNMIADSVVATVEAMFPTEQPTRPPDYVATLEAGLYRSRSDYPSLSLNPLDVGNERLGGLTPEEIELFSEYGVYFWDVVQAWVVVRSVLYSREVSDWDRDWLAEQMDLVRWMMPESSLFGDLLDRRSPGIRDIVSAYLEEVRHGDYAFRDSVTALTGALAVFDRAGADRFRDLSPEEAEEVWQLYFDAEAGGLRLGSVMANYGCSVCGELYRASGVPVRGSQ